jgi:hypothetical protein
MATPITPEYRAWKQARQRCRNPHNPDYHHYGGRGIEFRFETFRDFLNALKTAENPTGLRPSPQHSLDRYPNNDGHYEIGNMRWATLSEQRLNRRPFAVAVNNTSGTKGVAFVKKYNRWRAYGYTQGKNQMLGWFDNLVDAVLARKAWENGR